MYTVEDIDLVLKDLAMYVKLKDCISPEEIQYRAFLFSLRNWRIRGFHESHIVGTIEKEVYLEQFKQKLQYLKSYHNH